MVKKEKKREKIKSEKRLYCSQLTKSYTYTSREWDSEINLYYYRTRYYDSKMGRYISQDPIGFEADVNFYRYVRNDPVRFKDSKGLDFDIYKPIGPIPVYIGPILIPKQHQCGYYCTRQISPDNKDSIFDWVSFRHHFIWINGHTYSFPWGEEKLENLNHHTLLCYPIMVDKCKSCEEFEKCLKKFKWDDVESYRLMGNNCQTFTTEAMKSCGGYADVLF